MHRPSFLIQVPKAVKEGSPTIRLAWGSSDKHKWSQVRADPDRCSITNRTQEAPGYFFLILLS